MSDSFEDPPVVASARVLLPRSDRHSSLCSPQSALCRNAFPGAVEAGDFDDLAGFEVIHGKRSILRGSQGSPFSTPAIPWNLSYLERET
jgi:hypothetical protein